MSTRGGCSQCREKAPEVPAKRSRLHLPGGSYTSSMIPDRILRLLPFAIWTAHHPVHLHLLDDLHTAGQEQLYFTLVSIQHLDTAIKLCYTQFPRCSFPPISISTTIK